MKPVIEPAEDLLPIDDLDQAIVTLSAKITMAALLDESSARTSASGR